MIFLAVFLLDRFVVFRADFFADFLVVFFAVLRVVFLAGFLAVFLRTETDFVFEDFFLDARFFIAIAAAAVAAAATPRATFAFAETRRLGLVVFFLTIIIHLLGMLAT